MTNETVSITQLKHDCKLTPRDAGNGKLELTIESPAYFNLLPVETKTYVINTIRNLAASGALDTN
jgi:hypothetical protein